MTTILRGQVAVGDVRHHGTGCSTPPACRSPIVLDDLYAARPRHATPTASRVDGGRGRRSGSGRRPRRTWHLLTWPAGLRRRRRLERRQRTPMTRARPTARGRRPPGRPRRALPVRGARSTPRRTRQGRDQPGHRPVLGRADAWTRPGRSPSTSTTRRTSRRSGAPRRRRRSRERVDSTIYELHVRDFSIDDTTVPGGAPRHLPGVRRRRRRHAAPQGAGRRPASTPCTCCRPSTSPRSRRTAPSRRRPDVRPRVVRARQRAAAGVRRAPSPTRTPSTGATTRALEGAGGLVRVVDRGGRRRRAGRGVPHDGRRAAPDGLRVVLDQVFNHTAGVGPGADSRCSTRWCRATTTGSTPKGAVYTSTCCQNVATEHAMAREADGRLGRHRGRGTTRSTASGST